MIELLKQPRYLFLAMFLGCVGLMSFGLVLQEVKDLEPCPMCIIQRYAFILCGLIALAAALHNPGLTGRRIYAALIGISALGGGAVAARQSWIQHFPPAVADCGPDLEFMLDSFPLTQALPMVFRGTGDCSKVQWTFIGLSIPEWAIVCFIAIIIVSAYLMLRRQP